MKKSRAEKTFLMALFILSITVGTGAIAISPISAQTDPNKTVILPYIPLTNLPAEFYTDGNKTGSASIELSTFLAAAFRFGLIMSGLLAVIMITWGGFLYLSTDAMTNKSEGKEIIWHAVQGLFLALVSWLILYTINPNTLDLRLQSLQNFNIKNPPSLPTNPVIQEIPQPITQPVTNVLPLNASSPLQNQNINIGLNNETPPIRPTYGFMISRPGETPTRVTLESPTDYQREKKRWEDRGYTVSDLPASSQNTTSGNNVGNLNPPAKPVPSVSNIKPNATSPKIIQWCFLQADSIGANRIPVNQRERCFTSDFNCLFATSKTSGIVIKDCYQK